MVVIDLCPSQRGDLRDRHALRQGCAGEGVAAGGLPVSEFYSYFMCRVPVWEQQDELHLPEFPVTRVARGLMPPDVAAAGAGGGDGYAGSDGDLVGVGSDGDLDGLAGVG